MRKFPNDDRYDIWKYEEDGQVKRLKPVAWVLMKETIWGQTFERIDWAATQTKNPHLTADKRTEALIKGWIAKFWEDSAKLVTHDVGHPDANSRHKAVTDAVDRLMITLRQC